MKGRTHIAIGIATGVATGAIDAAAPGTGDLFSLAVITAASTLPDIDMTLGIGHRGVTHSILALIAGTAMVTAYAPNAAAAFAIGYGMHLFADSFTVSGVPLLWPWRKRIGAKLIRTGKRRRSRGF